MRGRDAATQNRCGAFDISCYLIGFEIALPFSLLFTFFFFHIFSSFFVNLVCINILSGCLIVYDLNQDAAEKTSET